MIPVVAQRDEWNVEHSRRHGVTPREVEEVPASAESRVIANPSASSRRPAIFGCTKEGRALLIADDILDDDVSCRI
jgi:hypothetical protein